MYCSNCGKEIKDGSRFCSQCGVQLATIVRPLPPVQKSTLPPPPIPKVNIQTQQNNSHQSDTVRYEAQQTYAVQQPSTDYWQKTENDNYGQNQYYQNTQFYGQQIYEQPMNWYKFVVWVQLFLSALSGVGTGIMMMFGLQYGSNRSLVYRFHPVILVLDIMFGIMSIGISAIAIFVRQQLVGFKENSYWMLLAYYALSMMVIPFVQALLYTIVVGRNCFTIITFVCMIGAGLEIALSYIYFDKRKAYFNQ